MGGRKNCSGGCTVTPSLPGSLQEPPEKIDAAREIQTSKSQGELKNTSLQPIGDIRACLPLFTAHGK